ncbi:MAG: hypothetical protein AB7N24_08815 [Dehalococcoidia bacterium]
MPTPTLTPAGKPVTPAPTEFIGDPNAKELRLPSGSPIGKLAVYAVEVRIASTVDRAWPTREVRAFDTGDSKEWAAFTYGGLDDYPVGEQLAGGRTVVVATERYVALQSLETGARREIYRAPNDVQVDSFSVSHDTTLVAVAVRAIDYGQSFTELMIFDISGGTGAAAKLVRTFDKSTVSLGGWFSYPQWLAGDVGLMVVGAAPKDGPGGRATVFMDGTSRPEIPEWRLTSPNGQFAWRSGATSCFGLQREELTIVDAVSDEPLGVYSEPGRFVEASEWARDSSAILFFSYADATGGCDVAQARNWGLLPVQGGPAIPVADPETVRRAWDAEPFFKLTCPGSGTSFAGADNDSLSCEHIEAGELTIDSVAVGQASRVRTLGLVP